MMNVRTRILVVILLLVGILPASAQLEHSLSAYSPYTMFGLGDMSASGTASTLAMGGIGLALRTPNEFNYSNPAALSAIPQNTAIFNIGAMSANYYQQTASSSTAFNTANLNDLGFAFPITRGLAMGFSLTQLSSVGYETAIIDDNPSVVENIGRAIYSYYGEGGVSELNTSIGWKVVGGFSIGATMHYDFGTLDRHWDSAITPLLGETSFSDLYSVERIQVQKLRASLGMQYQFRVGYDDHIIIGATYDFKSEGVYDSKTLSYVSHYSGTDTVSYKVSDYPITFPEKFAAGISYNNTKLTVGFDYSRQDWTDAFETLSYIDLFLCEDYRIGASYTPDRRSVNNFFKRLTYKVGARYVTSYIGRDGYQPVDWTATCGVSMPLKAQNVSTLNLAIEYGERGGVESILNEQYFKVVVGLSLFGGDDMWFVKRKFN
ncbi:MAG: hypothetical protein R3Y49_03225 [Rikenellaceae bacterium]